MTRLLFVHGILGKPDYFDFLRPHVPEDVSTTAILLEGHGKGPKEFAGASMCAWRAQVFQAITLIRLPNATHSSVHSINLHIPIFFLNFVLANDGSPHTHIWFGSSTG